MIIVTGGAGFIGSRLVRALNQAGHDNIVVIDDLSQGEKFRNLVDCDIADYWDKDGFIQALLKDEFPYAMAVVFHQGACSDTMEWDGKFMMQNNHVYSRTLANYCVTERIPFIYASSGSVYGRGKDFNEQNPDLRPLNVYGYSKLQFDRYVRDLIPLANSPVIGLRYFNVYGSNEQHKGRMASVMSHLNQQLLQMGKVKLFSGSDGYADGEQQRDFIHVEDVVKINIWAWQEGMASGVYNVGTGQSRSFNDVARAIIDWHGRGEIEYIPFPESLQSAYQSFTQADISALREAGYEAPMLSLEEGVEKYLAELNKQDNPWRYCAQELGPAASAK